MSFSNTYVPRNLSRKDQERQKQMLKRSKKNYTRGKYETRNRLSSYKNKPSAHITRARKIYGFRNIRPNRKLARLTGCSLPTLKKIVNKGEGAYYSSGSRPNQTAKSWGLARLASAITRGKAAVVDYHLLESGCNHRKKAYKMATIAKQQRNKQTTKKQYKRK